MKKTKALTLIELIIAVGIFVIVFLLTTSFVNLAAGQVKSTRTKTLTIDLRNAMDIISQKMNNANAKETVGEVIYGFRVKDNILGIASTDGNKTTCTFFGKNGDNIAMVERKNCGGQWPNVTDFTQVLNAPTVKITKFEMPQKYEMINSTPAQAPYLTIKIEAENLVKKNPDEDIITLQSSYALSADTVKRMK